MDKTIIHKLTIGIVTALFSIGVLCVLSPHFFPFTWDDSATYIETAEFFKEGKGFIRYAYGIDPVGTDYEPLTSFPIGYPLLIYGVSLLGIDMTTAAVWVPRICYVLLPYLLFGVLRTLGGNTFALFVTAVFVLMRTTLYFSLSAMSELPYLILALMSFWLAFLALNRNDGKWYFIASGLAAGLALFIRNVGYAIPLSVGAGLAVAAALGAVPRSECVKGLRDYSVGFLLGSAPFFVRNVIVHGGLQPYGMSDSDLGLYENIRQYVWALLISFGGNEDQSRTFLLAVGAAMAAGVIYFFRNRTEVLLGCRSRRCAAWLILVFYLVFGSVMVIIARTKYLWGEHINERHLLQYIWIYLALAAGACGFFFKRSRLKTIDPRPWALAGCVLLLLPQARMLFSDIRYQKEFIAQVRPLGKAKKHFGAFPNGTFVISTMGPKSKILLREHVRQMSKDVSPQELVARVCPTRPLTVILVSYNIKDYPLWQAVPPEGYQVAASDKGYVILYHPKIDGRAK